MAEVPSGPLTSSVSSHSPNCPRRLLWPQQRVDQSPRMEKRVGQASLALSTALSATTSESTARHISWAYL